MASIDTLARIRRVDLPTQQRRLRHLRSLAARNLVFEKGLTNGVSDIQTFFTLHEDKHSEGFYRSEVISGSLNPTWRSFDLSRYAEEKITTSSSVIIRLWGGQQDKFRLVCEWVTDLSGLVFLGNKIQKDGMKYAHNSLIFGMFEAFYGAPEEKKNTDAELELSKYILKVDQASVRHSYNVSSLHRIQTVLRAIKQTQVTAKRVRTRIEDKLIQSQNKTNKRSQCELLDLHVNQMRADLEWRTMQLQSEKESHERLQSSNQHKKVGLERRFETIEKDKDRLYEKKKAYFDSREEFVKANAQLVLRRKQLISELALIYPVQEMQSGLLKICGVRLPNSEDFYGEDDNMIAVALGYTCHLVQMVSYFLDVPLRYPVEHRVSRSMIRDHILDKLTDKERDFPLYSKGKEKFQFNYGVYLLNKNIAQLRYYCGLGTTDLRLTLPNLRSLLELRLGVKFESTNVMFPGRSLSGTPTLSSPSSVNSALLNPVLHLNEAENRKRGSSYDDIASLTMDQSKYRIVDGADQGSTSGSSTSGQPLSRDRTPDDDLYHLPTDATFVSDFDKENQLTASELPVRDNAKNSALNFDEDENFSSEENSSVSYRSQFKHWTHKKDSKGSDDVKSSETSHNTNIGSDIRTFKTNAMTSSDGHPSTQSSSEPTDKASSSQKNHKIPHNGHDTSVQKRTDALTSKSTFKRPNPGQKSVKS